MARTLSAAEFDEEVLTAPVPVLVDFWAEWCPPCKAMDPVLEEVSAALAGRAKVVKIDVDASPDITVRYNVRSMPTFILFKDGEPADLKIGAGHSRVALTKWIEGYAG